MKREQPKLLNLAAHKAAVRIVVSGGTIAGSDFREIEFFGNHITEGSQQAWILIACAVSLVIIPFLGIIFSSVKYLLGIKRKTKFVATTLGFIWIACLLVVIYLGISIGRNFRYEASVSNKMTISQPVNQAMHIQLDAIPENNMEHNIVSWSIKKDDFDDSLMFKHISVEFEKSLDTTFAVLVNKTARGYDRNNAKSNAQELNFPVTQNADSIITIPSIIQLAEQEKWRGQKVDIIIRVPENKYVYIDNRLDYYLDKNEYTSGLRDVELFNNKLLMTSTGLKPVN